MICSEEASSAHAHGDAASSDSQGPSSGDELPTGVSDDEARLLFERCGGNASDETLSRSDFERAAAADLARRKRKGLIPDAADPPLEC